IGVMGVSITLPILPLLAVTFELSATEVGLLITCFTLPSAFMTPVAGVLADRFGRKAILLPGLTLFALGGAGCALSQTFTELLCFRALQGLGAAPLGILYGTLVGDFYEETDRPGIMGMVGATISIGTALYPAVGGLLGELHWSFPFWVSLLALPVGALALCVPFEQPSKRMNWKQYACDSRSLLFNPVVIGLFGLTFLCFCILYGPTITYFPLLADLLFKASPSQIGMVFMLSSLGTALIAMNLARLGHSFALRRLMLCAVGCYCLAQGFMILLPACASSLWVLVLPLFLGGVAQGLTFPILTARMTSVAPAQNRGIVMAMNGTVLRLSQSVSPLAFGLGWTLLGWPGPYVLGLCVSVCIGILVLRIFPLTSDTR
ncbi:MAG: MFS transporter, partial [Bilophila sp.]